MVEILLLSTPLDRFLRDFRVMPVAFGEQRWREALEAFRRFGKGRHPNGNCAGAGAGANLAAGWGTFADSAWFARRG